MRTHSNIIGKTAFLVAAMVVAGCNSTTEQKPPEVLEVTQLTIPPVTATIDAGTNLCVLQVTNASGSFKNVPKNGLAITSPFNDIILQNVVIDYTWDDGVVVPEQTFGITATIPANSGGSATFAVANDPVLNPPGATTRAGHAATLLMKFFGVTVAGDSVSTVYSGGTLLVNTCATPPAAIGACCTGGGGCSQLSPANCSISGGTYQGDGSACATANCP